MSYHTGAVYQLDWSPFYPSYILSGSEDSRVVLWDLAQQTRRNVLDDQYPDLPQKSFSFMVVTPPSSLL